MTGTGALADAYARERSERTFRVLYRACAPAVHGFALRLTGGDDATAADLEQEAWMRALARLHAFDRGRDFARWVNGFLVNCWRERVRLDLRFTDELEGRTQGGGSWLDELAVRDAVDSLPDGFRAVVVLHDVEGYTHDEIGALLGIRPGTSRSQLVRARHALRTRLSDQEVRR